MMAEKKNKYDTNPLDPDFVRQTDEVRGSAETGAPERETRQQVPPVEHLEAPTRRYGAAETDAYQSVFAPPPAAAPLQPPRPFASAPVVPPVTSAPPTSRNIQGLNMPENVALIGPYIPFYIGAIIALLELLFVPRGEGRVRYHAAQGLGLHLVVTIVGLVFRFATGLADAALAGFTWPLRLAWWAFSAAAIIYFITSMIRIWQGQEHEIPQLADLTRWLNEKIEPRKK